MSNTPNKLELEYLKALGYKNPTTISKTNKPLVGKMIKYKIPLNYVSRNASKNNYKDLPDKTQQKFPNKSTKAQFIDKLINTYIENSKAEIINEDEDKFVDAQERIIPKPNFNSNEIPNVNNNLSKMSTTTPKWKDLSKEQRLEIINAAKAKAHGYMEYSPTKISKGLMKSKLASTEYADPRHLYWNTRTSYDPKLENPNYAAYIANKIGGTAYRGDFNDDGIDDIVVTTKKGNVKYVNGHSKHQSTRGKDLDYYDSDFYKGLSHKTEKGSLDVLSKKSKATFFNELGDDVKKAANATLKAAGFSTYQVKEKTLNKILKDTAHHLYLNVIDVITTKHTDVDKKKLKQQLPMSRFETLIVNAILLKLYNADFNRTKSYLDQLVINLKKAWNANKDYKKSVIEHANSVLDVLNKPEIIDKLAEPLYKITLKDSKHGEIYQEIIKLFGKGVTFNQQLIDYYRTKVDGIERARLDKVNTARKEYYEKHPDKKPAKKGKKATKKATKPIDEDLESSEEDF